MAERGAIPRVPAIRLKALRAVRSLFSPLLPDDYLELINPLWSTQELRGRIERIVPETPDAVSVLIRPGYEWPGHRPGQYLRIGVVVDGVHHWRAYSLTTDPGRPDGMIGITPKLVDSGIVSPYLVRGARPGDIVRLGGVEGTFVLPDPPPPRPLFVSAGSGITPIMAMLRALDRDDALADVVHIHSARTAEGVIFGERLADLAARHPGYRLVLRLTGEEGRVAPPDLDALCPDWRERDAFASGPGEMLDALVRPLATPRATRAARAGALPAGDRRRRRGRRRGRPDPLRQKRGRGRVATAPCRSWSPARKPAPSCHSAAGWGSATPASAASAPAKSATCAPARSTAPRARWSAPASTHRKARSRSRCRCAPPGTRKT